MCVPGYCPCNNLVNPADYGDRESEFNGLEVLEGQASMFYEDCFKPLAKNGTVANLTVEFLELMKVIERDNDCAGICEVNLFYFFQSATVGPPPKTCRQPLIELFLTDAGLLGILATYHGGVLVLYFLLQFRFWVSFGK